MKKPLVLLAALLLGAALFAQEPPSASAAPAAEAPQTLAPAKPTTLSLSRPSKRGDSHTLSVDVAIHSEGRMSAGDVNEIGGAQDLSFVFSAKVRVLDVNPAGEPTILVAKVEKAEVTKSEKKTEPMKVMGAELGVSFPQGKLHLVRRDGQEIPKEESTILGQIFQPPTGIDEDKLLGPGRPVAPGESWPLDKGLLMAEFKAGMPESLKVTADDIDGKATFLGIEPWNGTPCQKVAADYTIKTGDFGRFIGDVLTRIHQEMFVPVDPALKSTKRTSRVTTSVRGKVRTEENRLIDVNSQNTITASVEIK